MKEEEIEGYFVKPAGLIEDAEVVTETDAFAKGEQLAE